MQAVSVWGCEGISSEGPSKVLRCLNEICKAIKSDLRYIKSDLRYIKVKMFQISFPLYSIKTSKVQSFNINEPSSDRLNSSGKHWLLLS